MSTDALHHLIINLDVQDSGQRTNPGQLILRDVVHGAVQSAFAAIGIDHYRLPEDRGDGVLLVLPADVPKELMLGRWVNELHEALRARNTPLKEPIRVRLASMLGSCTTTTTESRAPTLTLPADWRAASRQKEHYAQHIPPVW